MQYVKQRPYCTGVSERRLLMKGSLRPSYYVVMALVLTLFSRCIVDSQESQKNSNYNEEFYLAVQQTSDIGTHEEAIPWNIGLENASVINIKACWEGVHQSDDANFKATVRSAIENGWNEWTRVNFWGWGDCTTADTNAAEAQHLPDPFDPSVFQRVVPIKIIDMNNPNANPKSRCLVNGVGPANGCASRGFRLAFEEPQDVYVELDRDMVNVSGVRWAQVALHEFGHLLGLSHEFQRDDFPFSCGSETGASPILDTSDSNHYGSPDPYSIMRYCRPDLGEQLISPTDIYAMRRIYGPEFGIQGQVNSLPALSEVEITVKHFFDSYETDPNFEDRSPNYNLRAGNDRVSVFGSNSFYLSGVFPGAEFRPQITEHPEGRICTANGAGTATGTAHLQVSVECDISITVHAATSGL